MHEISVRTVFSAAHAIRLPDGQPEPLHGHDWEVTARVGRAELDAIETVMDFHELEARLNEIVKPFHNASLNEAAPFANEGWNPTAERVAWWIGQSLQHELPEEVTLLSLSVTEAPGCLATYRPGE